MRVPIVTMQGLHPKAIAMSNSCGHWQYTNVAKSKAVSDDGEHLVGSDPKRYRDADWDELCDGKISQTVILPSGSKIHTREPK